jgi:hypothetical protein
MTIHPHDLDDLAAKITKQMTCFRGNLADAMFAIADALVEVADEIHKLDTPAGELEPREKSDAAQ